MARPTLYTEELGEKICERIAVTKSVTEALDFEGAPAISTFWSWLYKHPLLLDKYARGVSSRTERDNEELRSVAYNLDIPADHKRIIADTLKWQQARANPKRYGDKIAHVGGSEEDAPISVVRRVIVDAKESGE